MYSKEEVIQYIENEGVRFIRLAFCDVFGKQKNISIQPSEIGKAFDEGIAIEGSEIFGGDNLYNLYLVPDPKTMALIPWRSLDGGVIRMNCDIYTADKNPYQLDTRGLLKNVIAETKEMGISTKFASEYEFYLFQKDSEGNPTKKPLDYAGYMDIAPEDKGEDIRRQICFYLSEMGLGPKSSYHEAGPGQNTINFHASSPLRAADEAEMFKWIVKVVAQANGQYADFSPKPLEGQPGNGMIVKMVMDKNDAFLAGVVHYLPEMTCFLNPSEDSYNRLGKDKSPRMSGCTTSDINQALRNLNDGLIELYSPDNTCNPYIAFALILCAGMEGIIANMKMGEESLELPASLPLAKTMSLNSAFINKVLPKEIIEAYCK